MYPPGGISMFPRESVLGLVAVGLAGVLLFGANPMLVRLQEDLSLFLMPTAERSYSYGERHFGSQYSVSYDLERALYFFKETLRRDSNHPLAYHQLARIAFLQGDFARALRLIEIQIRYHPGATISSYYVKALIEGYMGEYEASARDYQVFLSSHPTNWAALNDYAWVLLKAERAHEAVVATARGLSFFPDNPWLLNTNAIALHEIGYTEAARDQARKAVQAAKTITEQDWLQAYPGNDAKIAQEGIRALQEFVRANMHTILVASREGGV